MLVDAHSHLNTDQLFPERKTYVQNFGKSWWKILINSWANNDYNEKWIEIAKKSKTLFPNLTVKATIWQHPHNIPHNESDFLLILDRLKQLYEQNKNHIVAIWECGIDLHFPENANVEIQQNAFRKQAELARELKIPLIIHSRDWFKETIEVLRDFSDLKIYFHARSYWASELKEVETIFPYLRIGCTNVIWYPNAKEIRKAISAIKSAKILTETDAPFLPPQCFRGKQNEPAYVSYVYEKLSEILEINQNKLEKIVENNAKSLFSL